MAVSTSLAGLRVLEVATYIPGPVCTKILAGMGASVTKVSRLGGDPLRDLAPLNLAYDLFNAGKVELELDLKAPEGAAALRDLALRADVLVDGLRPGALERMGLGPAVLRAANPRLIVCALSAFGLAGPDREKAGHDLNLVALSGLLAGTAVAGEPALPGTQLADLVSGLMAATAILAACHDRTTTGVGCTLDAPMLGAARWLMAPWYAVEQAGASAGLLNGDRAYYCTYRTADGRHLAVAALEPHFWERFCGLIGRPDLTPRQHAPDQAALSREVAAAVSRRTLAEWQADLADLDACVSPALSAAEAAALGPAQITLPVIEVGPAGK